MSVSQYWEAIFYTICSSFLEIFLPKSGSNTDICDGRHGAFGACDWLSHVRLRTADAGITRLQFHLFGHALLWRLDLTHRPFDGSRYILAIKGKNVWQIHLVTTPEWNPQSFFITLLTKVCSRNKLCQIIIDITI